MTPETIGAGWFLVAASFVIFGVALIAWGRSAWADRRAARTERHRAIAADTAEIMAFLQGLNAQLDAEEADWAAWFADCPRDPAPLASVTPLPLSPRVLKFPTQRNGGAS